MKNLRHLLRRVNPTKSRQTSEVRSRGPLSNKRRLLSETLERRQLLAGDVVVEPSDVPDYTDVDDYAIAHNYWNKFDVNNDGYVTALDALRVINYMNESPEGEPTGAGVEYAGFVDVNADHLVSSLDALQVINQLNGGEGADETFDVRLELTPRNLDDSVITQTGQYTTDAGGTGIEYTVNEGDIFKLEIGVQDGRFITREDFGVFQVVTNIVVGQTGVLEPAVGEIQGFDFDRSILSNNSATDTIEFFFDDGDSEVIQMSVGSFIAAPDSAVAQRIKDAIIELTNEPGELNITADDIDVTAFAEPGAAPYEVRVEYNGLDFAGVDIPTFRTRLTVNGVEQNVVVIEENVKENGVFNVNTLVGRYETFMRNHPNNIPPVPSINDGLGPLIYGQNRNIGSFDVNVNGGGTDIFDEVGTLGPVGNLRTLIPGFTGTEVYDAFSIPVRAVKAATDVGVKLTKAEPRAGFEGILLYGTDNGKESVALEDIRLDEDAEFRLNVTGTQTGITAANADLPVQEDDPDGETVQLSVTALSGETPTYAVTNSTTNLGVASISSTGVFTYTPNENAFGTDLVTYTATTATDGTATATVTVTIAAVNDPPIANDDPSTGTLSVDVGDSILISVLANDDAGGNFTESLSELSIAGTTNPTRGSITVEGNQIRYTPSGGVVSGTDTFTYTITDGEFTSASATVTVNVVNNQAGVSAGDKSITIDEDNSSVGGAATSEVLVADLGGADAGLITVNTGTGFTLNSAQVTSGLGTVRVSGNQILYTPAQDDFGTATITYNASNADGGDDGIINVTITSVNDRPVATNLDFAVNEGSSRTINVLQPGGGQTPPSDVETPTENLLVSLAPGFSSPLGTVQVVNNQIVVTSTATAAQGNFAFQYRVTDANGAVSDNASISINIVDVQDAPVAGDRTEPAVNEGAQTITVDLSTLTTVEGNVPLTFSIESQASFGTASVSGTNLLFTLGPDENGIGGEVVYRAAITADPTSFDLGTVTFTVNAVNDAPTLGTIDDQTVQENGFVDIDVLAKASDPENDVLTIEVVNQGTKGVASVVNGLLRYQTNTDAVGADSLQVRVTDPSTAASNTQTININIIDVILAPVASPGTLNAVEDGANVTLNLAPLVNAQAGNVTFTITQPGAGSASVSNGILTYDPDADFFGQTSLTYTAANALGTSTNTITINVSATNDAPIAVDDSVDVIKNIAKPINVLANDTPNPGGETDTITVTVAAGDGPSHGTISITNNIITYTPNTDYSGPDSFIYTVSDGQGGSDTATVTIDVKNFIPSEVTGQLYLDSITNLSQVITNGATPQRSGAYEPGETTLAGVRVQLTAVGGASGSSFTAVTDTRGRYTFDNVPPGNYEIRYNLPPGMKVSGPGATGVIPVTVPETGGLVGDNALQGNFNIESLGTYITSGRNVVSTPPGTENLPDTITPGEMSTFFFTATPENVLIQNTVLVGRDFGDAKFVELLINQQRDEALLVVVDDDLNVESAVVRKERFMLMANGSDVAVELFGGLNDFVFEDVDSITDITSDYPEYAAAIDELFSNL
ncbi:Ig-like domain-containing protein [Aporhodopirellula aestuarii]|uniref:Ig-like domain-containing protein n=1 Tax=Aporhodopirellula aestuarii TaxID=2950107 RepID=A0ABT0U7E3_9BACT|nr:Ig-like domain-containing protein [Aporhodopirellula aestuarii]MCM2372859.1 Ig-like domain-containing protein [Aporhodopirellula aestuarii]